MSKDAHRISIKAWAEDDRPREKLLSKGRNSLSDAELIAILIGSGTPKESAVELSKRILNKSKNNLNDLGRFSVNDLCKFNGIGKAKAVSIVAALELGRRRSKGIASKKKKISSSRQIYDLFHGMLGDLPHEEFWALALNQAHHVLEYYLIGRGGVNATYADGRLIFKGAVELLASSIVLIHNHPSGNIIPSQADIDLTDRLVEAGRILNIKVIDHVIIAHTGYYSFKDQGLLD